MANITFVDENDTVIGAGTKQQAWSEGTWHRIARIFIFNSKGEMLIQKRSMKCKSLPGRWDQSAAGHVDEGETYIEAACREMKEEVGVSVALAGVVKIKNVDTDEKDKIKKRFSMLFTGNFDGEIHSNPEEVSESSWIQPVELGAWMRERPGDFTQGFIESFRELNARLQLY